MAKNKRRLIEAGADLFHRQGYAGTSLDDILTATGVARSNFYYHFKSKLALARAVARHWVTTYEAQIVEPSLGRQELPARERLQAMFARAADSQDPVAGRTGSPLGRLSTDLAAADPQVRDELDGYFAGLRKRVAGVIGEARRVGSAEEADQLAEIALCILEGGLLFSNLRGSSDRISAAGVRFLALLQPDEAGRLVS